MHKTKNIKIVYVTDDAAAREILQVEVLAPAPWITLFVSLRPWKLKMEPVKICYVSKMFVCA